MWRALGYRGEKAGLQSNVKGTLGFPFGPPGALPRSELFFTSLVV